MWGLRLLHFEHCPQADTRFSHISEKCWLFFLWNRLSRRMDEHRADLLYLLGLRAHSQTCPSDTKSNHLVSEKMRCTLHRFLGCLKVLKQVFFFVVIFRWSLIFFLLSLFYVWESFKHNSMTVTGPPHTQSWCAQKNVVTWNVVLLNVTNYDLLQVLCIMES